MLSALAKYIFGGVVGDAPETTSMQYETREINDWLLVDMPDQDIDNEDMDSESDEDDILTAVPLLLAEDASMSPRQIVLSYEPDSPCDKSYTKIRKGLQDKIHSASSKVQVHAGDKIQGNFVANVEAISLETGDISSNKMQHNLSKVQENTKTKQSKSKNLKSKKSKKNKINKKCITKIQDMSVIKKKCIDDVQKSISESTLTKLKNEMQCVPNEVPENLGITDECKSVEKVEDCHPEVSNNPSFRNVEEVEDCHPKVSNNPSFKNVEKVEDCHIEISNNPCLRNVDKVEENSHTAIDNKSNHKTAGKSEKNSHLEIIKLTSHTNVHKVEDSQIMITDNPSNENRNVSQNILGNSADKVQENATNEVPKKSDRKFQPNSTFIENNLCNMGKRSYADVVKATSDVFDKDCNKEVLVDKKCKTEPESSEVILLDTTENIQLEIKDDKKPKNKKNKSKKSCKNKIQNDADIKLQNVSASVSPSNQNISQENVNYNQHLVDQTTIASIQIQENPDHEIEDSFYGKGISNENEEKSTVRTLDPYLVEYDNFTDDIYFESYDTSDNENVANFINCQVIPKEVNDNHKNEIKNSNKFDQDLDDQMLEDISDLWDIYTKIQDNSDDEVPEISYDETNEDDISDREMNEISDERITDDEMNENSQDEYEEMSGDESNGVTEYFSSNLVFENILSEDQRKQFNYQFQFSRNKVDEDSDGLLIVSRRFVGKVSSEEEMRAKLIQEYKSHFLEEVKENVPEIPKHHSSCIPLAECELVEYFNYEPQHLHVCQSLQYPSSYALAIAEYYSNQVEYYPKYPERCNAFVPKYKRRAVVDNHTSPAPNEPSLITNTAELLEKLINHKCSVLPTKTAVVLEHVKDLKPVQQAIQYEARKYLTRSQLNRQNRNYIYQSSTKTNRRRNLQRNHSGVNNNRKCC